MYGQLTIHLNICLLPPLMNPSNGHWKQCQSLILTATSVKESVNKNTHKKTHFSSWLEDSDTNYVISVFTVLWIIGVGLKSVCGNGFG